MRGKILNVERSNAKQILTSNEIGALITAIGAGVGNPIGNPEDDNKEPNGKFDLEKMRYHKVIIMTDADVDGSHIRTLLLTFFYRHMKPLIESGRLYIAQPPLYRAKKGTSIQYLKDENEMEEFLMNEGSKNLTMEKPSSNKKIDQITGKDLMSLIKLAKKSQKLILPLTRRIDNKLIIEQAAVIAALKPESLENKEIGLEIAKYLELRLNTIDEKDLESEFIKKII